MTYGINTKFGRHAVDVSRSAYIDPEVEGKGQGHVVIKCPAGVGMHRFLVMGPVSK